MARRLKQNTPRSRTAACIKTEHREKKRMGILKQFRAGKLAVIICSDRKQLGLLAGADAAEAIRRAIAEKGEANVDRKSTRLNSSHNVASRMPSSA